MKILCLDDNELMRSVTSDLLHELGHEVLEADGGDEAIRWINRCGDRIDLLVLDICMPSGLDGRQVANYARGLYPMMPVIYFTAFEGRKNADPERDWFLSKPCSLGMLAQAITSVCARTNRRASSRHA